MKKYLYLLIVTVLILTVLSNCKGKADDDLHPGDVISGFTLNEYYDSSLYNSGVYTFHHSFSGADLVYVKNDDPEVSFTIGYHTPSPDETDTNHVFEHAILSGSEKYPSRNLFYDLNNMGYLTFCNAATTYISTHYTLSSKSEDQLLKAMDAYLSCMVSPNIMKDDRIFQREAIRYELNDINDDITIKGTVFSEDYGLLANISEKTNAAVLDALYPGETASNSIGLAYLNYQDLTYEHTLETYHRYYHFDNCLIFLYGDLDMNRFLEFLDDEYLSAYPAEGTDLSAFADDPTEPGFMDVQVSIPAFKGDKAEGNSTIVYAIDLSDKTATEIFQYFLLKYLFNQPESVLHKTIKEKGIENPVSSSIAFETAKPFIEFIISNADPEQKTVFKEAIEAALSKVAEDGIEPSFLNAIQKAIERNEKLLLNGTNVGADLSIDFLLEWIHFGDPDFFKTYEDAVKLFQEENAQNMIRGMAKDLLTPKRSALVTAVPTPGMAEELERERSLYLKELKASMTQNELQNMVRETIAFNEWNTTELQNNDFMISPENLPDPNPLIWSRENKNGILVYNGETSLKGIGEYAVYFDLSGMSREELMYLMLFQSYFFKMNTQSYTTEELSLLKNEYISNLSLAPVYPNSTTGEYHRPMLKLSFISLTEDFDKSLELLTDVFTKTDLNDADNLKYVTSVAVDSFDISRNIPDYIIARHGASTDAGPCADSEKFSMDINWQDTYYLIKEVSQKLDNDKDYAAELAAKYENVVRKAFTKDNLIFMSVTSKEDAGPIAESAVKILAELPKKAEVNISYSLPTVPKSLAFCIEDSMTSTYMAGDCMTDPGFKGEYIPFIYALNDRYTVPTFRFQLGSYSAGTNYASFDSLLYTYLIYDPDVGKSIQALDSMPGILKDLDISSDQLNGYILKSYSDATKSYGLLDNVMYAMHYDLLGLDYDRYYTVLKAIKNSSIKDQQEASEHIASILSNATLCTAGNEKLIRAHEDCFDEIISLRTE